MTTGSDTDGDNMHLLHVGDEKVIEKSEKDIAKEDQLRAETNAITVLVRRKVRGIVDRLIREQGGYGAFHAACNEFVNAKSGQEIASRLIGALTGYFATRVAVSHFTVNDIEINGNEIERFASEAISESIGSHGREFNSNIRKLRILLANDGR